MVDDKLYAAIVEAEKAARKAHDLCYGEVDHGASMWLAMALGRAQSILMHYVVRYASRKNI